MNVFSIEWKDDAVRIIDQTQLPQRLIYIYIRDIKTLWKAIKLLQVRGAPTLGAAAALGVYLGIKGSKAKDFKQFFVEMEKVIKYIGTSRPTARNLFWGLEEMRNIAVLNKDKSIQRVKELLFRHARHIIEEDKRICRLIGEYGQSLISNGDTIMTVCNAGSLATIDYGTALGLLYKAQEKGKCFKVFACETRPLFQGARLTAWELKRKGIDVTLICDNMAAAVMASGKVNMVVTGADRIASNGDTANKIGTYSLAVLSRYHNIPFYVAAPLSTFDLSIGSGKEIQIEQRDPDEVTSFFFKKRIAPENIKVFNPAFDVTDNSLISAIITEKGILRPPYIKNIKEQACLSPTI
jgi:methylthioribose-1-phosphate isomerase